MSVSQVRDLNDPAVFSAGIPHDVFDVMRSTPGLTWVDPSHGIDRGYWALTRYHDVVAVSRDPETYSSAVGHIQTYDIDEDALEARASMIDMDAPVHTRLRRLVSSAFTPRHVKDHQAAIRQRVRATLDRLERDGGGNWIDIVAKPIPIGVICDILGVPEEDHGHMIELSDHLVAGTSSVDLDPGAYGNTTELRLLPFNSPAAHGVNEYARQLAERRRREPADDLVTQLLEATVDGQRLTESEFSNFFRLMIFAGNETTRSAIGHLALQLVAEPEQFARVAADRALLGPAVEEVVRHGSPILYFRRTATCATELAGTQIAPGDKVVMWYSAANFDPEVFPEPKRFVVDRPATPPQIGYGGGGPHFCLGASLARLELTELLDEVLVRGLDLELVGVPEFVDSNFVNGLEHVEVRLR
ncbi:MAG: cytochrome P450 [Ilumatobacteraceae bacterium]